MDIGCGIGQLGMAVLPELLNLLEQLEETRPASALIRWKISAAKERFQLGSKEYVQRPAALPGGRLDEGHIDLVHVWPFLAIDFDADEMLVEKLGHFLALERFTFHDVAPVAGRVADADKDRFVLLPRFRKG